MAVSLGATITTAIDLNSRTSWTVAHTVDSGTTLLVVASQEGGAISGITYNGVAMTLFVTAAVQSNKRSIYYLKNPAIGANNIIVTMNSTSDHGITAWNFSGNDTTTPMEGASAPGLDGDSTTITTTVNGEYIVCCMATNNTGSTWTYSTGTKRLDSASTNLKFASGEQVATTAGSQTVTWSKSSGTSDNCFAAVKAVTPVNSNFFTFMPN